MGKKSIIIKIVGIVVITLLLLATASLIYTLLLFNGIENFYRIMGSIILLLIINLIVGSLLIGIKDGSIKKLIIFGIISLLLTVGFSIGTVYLYNAYAKIDNFNKETITHNTALISKNKDLKIDNLKNVKIGMIDEEDNIEGYILPLEVIEKYNLSSENEIIKYSDNLTLMNALYKGEVDLIFITGNYAGLFRNIEGYEKIDEEVFKIHEYGKDYKKSDLEDDTTEKVNLTKPMTILLMGVDSADDGLAANASFNGDTIMLISFDPVTLNATMFSIPRDTYVTMACGGSFQKINHAAWGGTNCMVKTVEKLTGLGIDYYVKINFKGVVDLVNTVGGITVDVPVPDYPSEYCLEDSNRVYKNVCLTAGVQRLDGEHALALARVRKAFALGDFQRGQNQQLVVEALMQELKNVRSIKKFYEVLDAVSRNIDTNMTTDEMLSFYNVGKSLLFSSDNNVINIQKTWLRGYSLYAYEPSSGNYTYTFQYYKGSLNDIVNAMKINLGTKTKEEIKTLNFSIKSPYEKTVVGDRSYSEAKIPTVPNFVNGYSVSSATSWGSARGITITTENVTSGELFNSAYPTGKIVGQSVHADTLLQRVSGGITLYVIKNDNSGNGGNTQTPIEKPEEETPENNGEEEPVTPVIPGIPEESTTE